MFFIKERIKIAVEEVNEMNILERKECVLYDRECIGCMECEVCDLDENKICDNCGKCLEIRDDAIIKIDKIIIDD